MKALLSIPLLSALVIIFFFTPEEASQGLVQKIFYVHVSSAFTMYLAFFIAFLAGILHLTDRRPMWDRLNVSAVDVGMLFCLIVLSTGPVWARPIWGTWWTWEPRLTTTFLLFLIYCAYAIIRSSLQDSPRRATICAVISLIAFLDVPLIHYSVKLWRGIHPTVINNKSGGLPPSMTYALAWTMLGMLGLFTSLIMTRYRLESLQAKLADHKNDQSTRSEG